MTRLEAMRNAMMTGQPTMQGSPATGGDPRVAGTRVGQIIAQLQASLAAERKARVAAETRLRAVLAQVAKMFPAKPKAVTTPKARPAPRLVAVPPSPETRRPEPAPVETVEGEVIEPETLRETIMAVGGDDVEEHEEDLA